jgi:7,8-dihydropterin-6-yl-methyl-4-(beta-D-ribofuranosyl)aminobenzene 5'-phosphate synthase
MPLQPERQSIGLVIVYDNNPFDDRLYTAWGFACVVRLGHRTILFDTGGDSQRLLHNMQQLAIGPGEIDDIFFSHIDGDHTGGLSGLLEHNSDVVVYLPQSFPVDFKQEITSAGARVVETSAARELMPGVYTTGELGGEIKEQSLVLKTADGLVVITGCAHPGIVKIITKAKEVVHATGVKLAIGGFHLAWSAAAQIQPVIDGFKRLGVVMAAPCHCSGDQARQMFQRSYGAAYLEVGVGTKIELPGLATGR